MVDEATQSDGTAQSAGATHLTDDSFQGALDKAKQDGVPVFVDFFAEWCGPCKLAAPIVDKLSGEYAGRFVIAKVDVDENNETARQHGVMSIPTVVIFKDGQEVDRQVGFAGEEGYRKLLDKHVVAGGSAA